MSALRLRLLEERGPLVDAAPLLPERLAGRLACEIEREPLQVGNCRLPLAEVFEVREAGAEGDLLVIEGGSARLRHLGSAMTAGRLRVDGEAGDHLGASMTGGTIDITGSAGAFAGTGMTGGVIRVGGSAGPFAGAALPGAMRGMSGGALLVQGDLGDRAGDRMRRGIIAAAGRAGAFLGSRMIAGTIVALAGCGPDPGFGMRRGTLLLGAAERMLPTFADAGPHDLGWLALLIRELRRTGFTAEFGPLRRRRLVGCASAGGQGEILLLERGRA